MLNIGAWELILILIVVLIVFGPGKLPDVAKSLGKAVREFRKASSNIQRVWDDVTREDPAGKTAQSSKTEASTKSSADNNNKEDDSKTGDPATEQNREETENKPAD